MCARASARESLTRCVRPCLRLCMCVALHWCVHILGDTGALKCIDFSICCRFTSSFRFIALGNWRNKNENYLKLILDFTDGRVCVRVCVCCDSK